MQSFVLPFITAMFAPSLVPYLYSVGTIFVAASSSHQLDMQTRDTMHHKIEAFIGSLDLPSSQAQILASKLEGDSNLAAFLDSKDYDSSDLISLACQSAQICLGADSVDTTPQNQTRGDANWSVVFSAQETPKANHHDEGLKPALFPQHASYCQSRQKMYLRRSRPSAFSKRNFPSVVAAIPQIRAGRASRNLVFLSICKN